MVEAYDAHKIEDDVLKHWETHQTYPKAKDRVKKGKKFFFLQGPPYTSGRFHIGHAWNNSCKDIIMRYKRLRGYDVWDRGGYDMHGLPTENKVQKELGLESKKEIEKFGIEPFVVKCKEYCTTMAKHMDKDMWRMGIWMDNEHAYYPIDNDFIEGEWLLIKKAWEQQRLYKGKKAMQWCSFCETALAKHELEYQTDKDMSIFLKFELEGKPGEFLVVWTTTPWTIPFNLAVMVNPELEYVKAKVDSETWIIASPLVGILLGMMGKKYSVVGTIMGADLEGAKYHHPLFKDIPQFEEMRHVYPKLHSVLLSEEYVDASAGSGLVHCAPGCGPEDFEVGQKNGLPAFNLLDERGIFQDAGRFTGMRAKVDDAKFIQILDNKGIVLMQTPVEHEYAHHERCKEPVVFRTTDQWFMKTEDLREKMLKGNEKVNWVPERCGRDYANWIASLRDNSITRQRYWGAPVPIWECKSCGKTHVIGSLDELKKLAVDKKMPADLHRPWIDEVKIKCDCKATVSRIPDVLDVWLDAGTVSWNCLYYPKEKKHFDKYYPADFVCEATEQTHLWFSMLNICSTIVFGKQCFENVYTTGMILDYQGTKMSKSLGNIISPYEVMDKHGADVLRNYFAIQKSGENMNFSWEDVKQVQRNHTILWNLHKLLIDLCETNKVNPSTIKPSQVKNGLEESFILSKMHSAIKRSTELYDQYKVDDAQAPASELFLALSREYIQFIREKSVMGTEQEKLTVIKTIYDVLFASVRLLSPVVPFLTERIFLNFKEAFKLKEDSLFLMDWPKFDEGMIDEGLEQKFVLAEEVMNSALNCREKAQINVRWPLSELLIVTEESGMREAMVELEHVVKQILNVKSIRLEKRIEQKEVIRADYAKLNPEFRQKTPFIIAKLALTSQQSILSHIEKEGFFAVDVDGETHKITKEHLIIEHHAPDGYVTGVLTKGMLLLKTTMDDALKGEGYTREFVRRVQTARKNANLQRTDTIQLLVSCDEQFKSYLEGNKTYFLEKVGAKSLTYGTADSEPKAKDKIKDKQFAFWF